MLNKGTENLIPCNERSKDEVKEIGRKGGIASGKARREKRDLKKCLEILLEKDIKARNGETMSGAEAIAIKQFEKALKGDTKAFEVVRDTAGQKPIERIATTEIDSETLQQVQDIIKEVENE